MRSRTRRAPTPATVGEPSEPVSELTIHLGLSLSHNVRPGHDHQVEPSALRPREVTEPLAEETPGSIPFHGRSDLPAHGQAQPMLGPVIGERDHEELPPTEPGTLLEDTIELRADAQPPVAPETP
jgi:hypothetical protein